MDKPDELPASASSVLPLKRIKKIMKSNGPSQINNEAVFLMAKSTELFVKHFAQEVHATSEQNGGKGNIKYEHVSQLVDNSEKFGFLLRYVPGKISVKEFKKIFSGGKFKDDTDDED